MKNSNHLNKIQDSQQKIIDLLNKFNASEVQIDRFKNDPTTLNLRANNIGPEGAKAIAKAVKDNPVLTTLDLSSNNIGPEGAKAIADAVKDNPVLTTLDLSSNNIGPEGAKYIADAFKDNTALADLSLFSNNLGPEGTKYIADAIKNNIAITKLGIGSNNIGPEGAKYIADALKNNTALADLSLFSNNFGPEGAQAIADALKNNKTLTTLYLGTNGVDFGSNNFGPEGAQDIADALKNNTTLTTLYLKSNDFGLEGIKYIAEALKNNIALTTLYLSTNGVDPSYSSFGSEGAKYIAEALKNNTTLTTLYLERNDIGSEGAEYIAEALKNNTTLTTLYLKGNDIGPEETKAMANMLKNNHTISKIFLLEQEKINNITTRNNKLLEDTCEFMLKHAKNPAVYPFTANKKYVQAWQVIGKAALKQMYIDKKTKEIEANRKHIDAGDELVQDKNIAIGTATSTVKAVAEEAAASFATIAVKINNHINNNYFKLIGACKSFTYTEEIQVIEEASKETKTPLVSKTATVKVIAETPIIMDKIFSHMERPCLWSIKSTTQHDVENNEHNIESNTASTIVEQNLAVNSLGDLPD